MVEQIARMIEYYRANTYKLPSEIRLTKTNYNKICEELGVIGLQGKIFGVLIKIEGE